MNRTPADIFDLPAAARVEIAQELWESVAEHPETLELTSAQRAELERRWRAFTQSPDEGETWEEVVKALRQE